MTEAGVQGAVAQTENGQESLVSQERLEFRSFFPSRDVYHALIVYVTSPRCGSKYYAEYHLPSILLGP
jgi:hypothetical protein